MALLSSVFRGMGNMRLPAMLMVLGAAIQIPLSGTLILGWFGVPQFGIRGCRYLGARGVRAQHGAAAVATGGEHGYRCACAWIAAGSKHACFNPSCG